MDNAKNYPNRRNVLKYGALFLLSPKEMFQTPPVPEISPQKQVINEGLASLASQDSHLSKEQLWAAFTGISNDKYSAVLIDNKGAFSAIGEVPSGELEKILENAVIARPNAEFMKTFYTDAPPALKEALTGFSYLVFTAGVIDGRSRLEVDGVTESGYLSNDHSASASATLVNTHPEGQNRYWRLYNGILAHEGSHASRLNNPLPRLLEERESVRDSVRTLEYQIEKSPDLRLRAEQIKLRNVLETADYLAKFEVFNNLYPDQSIHAGLFLDAKLPLETIKKFSFSPADPSEKGIEMYHASQAALTAMTLNREDALVYFRKVFADTSSNGMQRLNADVLIKRLSAQ